MTDKNKNESVEDTTSLASQSGNNPFENNRPVADDISEAKEELENEQVFKEAQTERD